MLLERAAGLAANIAQYQKLRNTADEAEQFLTRANQLGALSEKVARTRAMLVALAQAGIVIDFKPNDGPGYAAKANKLRLAIKDDPAAINDPPFDIKNEFTDRISSIADVGEKAATEAWNAYVGRRADFGADDVLSALGQVPQFRTSVAKIRQIRASVAALGLALPNDPKAAVSQLGALVAEHESAWSALAAEDMPTSVVAFIRAAANEGALVAAYTDEVRTWLESRKLLDAFRIKLRW